MKKLFLSILLLFVLMNPTFSQTSDNVEEAVRFRVIQPTAIINLQQEAVSQAEVFDNNILESKSSPQIQDLGSRYGLTHSQSQVEELGSRYGLTH